MTDKWQAEVNIKIKKSFCPPGIVKDNPCFDYLKHLVFQKFDEFPVTRKPDNGGDKYVILFILCHWYDACRVYKSYDEVAEDYEKGLLHPNDLKPALAKSINAMIQPVRQHFATDPKAKQLLQTVRKYKVTR